MEELEGKERLTGVSRAFLFDVDGVITNPSEKRVKNPQILDEILKKLKNGEPVALITGRALKWVVERVVEPLEFRIKNKNLLERFFVSGEFGGSSITFKNRRRKSSIDRTIVVPKEITDISRSLTESKFRDTMFIDSGKETMVSIEMKDDLNVEDFRQKQKELEEILNKYLSEQDFDKDYEVHIDRIATNIRSKKSNKRYAAKQVVKWIKSLRLSPDIFLVLGDAQSDTEISDQLNKMHFPVKLIFVGEEDELDGRKFPYEVEFTSKKFEEGTLEYLKIL